MAQRPRHGAPSLSAVKGVVDELLTVVLPEARQDAGREVLHVRYHLKPDEQGGSWPPTDKSIKRWETGDSTPPSFRLDAIVTAYAIESNVERGELWQRAVTNFRRREELGDVESPTAADQVRRRRSAADRSAGKQRPKAI